jgi:hypothetical protein
MANWSLPTLSSLYSAVLSGLSDRLNDAAKMFDSTATSPTNLPTNTKRWNATSSKFEKWSGSAWSDLATTYSISISGTASTASGLSAGVALANIGAAGITYSYLQNISATKRLLGRNSAGAGVCQEVTLSQLLDWVGTAAQGDILYRGSTSWARLAAGTSGQVLTTQGAGANPLWASATIASTAEAQAGTENTKSLSALRLREGLNASGTAPIYACRAWVNFNGTGTVGIRSSGNVSSITDNGTGDYTVNFTTAMPDEDYAVCVGGSRITSGGTDYGYQIQTWEQLAGSVRFNTPSTSGANTDWARVSLAIFR